MNDYNRNKYQIKEQIVNLMGIFDNYFAELANDFVTEMIPGTLASKSVLILENQEPLVLKIKT